VPGDEGEVKESFEVNKVDRGRERERAKEKQGVIAINIWSLLCHPNEGTGRAFFIFKKRIDTAARDP
jgi:hypothetical protein